MKKAQWQEQRFLCERFLFPTVAMYRRKVILCELCLHLYFPEKLEAKETLTKKKKKKNNKLCHPLARKQSEQWTRESL
jgi:predicted Zn-dependent protease